MTTDSNDLTCISPNTIPYEELVKIQGSITAAIVVSVFYKDDRWQVTLPGGIDAFKCKWAETDIVIGDHFENQICAIYKKKNLTEFCKDRSKRVRWFYLLNQPSSSDSPCIDYYSSEIDESSQYLFLKFHLNMITTMLMLMMIFILALLTQKELKESIVIKNLHTRILKQKLYAYTCYNQ